MILKGKSEVGKIKQKEGRERSEYITAAKLKPSAASSSTSYPGNPASTSYPGNLLIQASNS